MRPPARMVKTKLDWPGNLITASHARLTPDQFSGTYRLGHLTISYRIKPAGVGRCKHQQ